MTGLLQPLQFPKWKWEQVFMEFTDGLPVSHKGNEGIWVIVNRLIKVPISLLLDLPEQLRALNSYT